MKFPAKILPDLCALLMLTGCATIAPPQPPSLELPKPPSDLRATRKGERVTLTWTAPNVTTDRQTVRSVGPTKICRGLEQKLNQCGTPVGEAPAQPTPNFAQSAKQNNTKQNNKRSFTDLLTQIPGYGSPGIATYAVEALNAAGRGAGLSNQVHMSLARTLPPPQDFAARVTAEGIVLTWIGSVSPTNSAQPAHYIYRIYRRMEGSQEQTRTGEILAGDEPNFSFTDSNIQWEKTYEYRAETVTVIAQENQPEVQVDVQVEGDDTPEIKVFAHDIFPPAVPSGLQAVASGPGQKTFVDLVWAPVTDADLDGYNIYRHEEGSPAVKVTADPVKTPAYRDDSVASGKNYLYSVSAVDVRGNESGRSEEAGERVP